VASFENTSYNVHPMLPLPTEEFVYDTDYTTWEHMHTDNTNA